MAIGLWRVCARSPLGRRARLFAEDAGAVTIVTLEFIPVFFAIRAALARLGERRGSGFLGERVERPAGGGISWLFIRQTSIIRPIEGLANGGGTVEERGRRYGRAWIAGAVEMGGFILLLLAFARRGVDVTECFLERGAKDASEGP